MFPGKDYSLATNSSSHLVSPKQTFDECFCFVWSVCIFRG